MRTLAVFVILAAALQLNAQTTTVSSVPFATPNRGGAVIQTVGAPNDVVVGYARVQPAASTTPAADAVFAFRQNDVLVNETGSPAVTPILAGRTFAEFNGSINTGLAIANPNPVPTTVTFTFADQFGNESGQQSFILNANAQIARFLNEP